MKTRKRLKEVDSAPPLSRARTGIISPTYSQAIGPIPMEYPTINPTPATIKGTVNEPETFYNPKLNII